MFKDGIKLWVHCGIREVMCNHGSMLANTLSVGNTNLSHSDHNGWLECHHNQAKIVSQRITANIWLPGCQQKKQHLGYYASRCDKPLQYIQPKMVRPAHKKMLQRLPKARYDESYIQVCTASSAYNRQADLFLEFQRWNLFISFNG